MREAEVAWINRENFLVTMNEIRELGGEALHTTLRSSLLPLREKVAERSEVG